MVSPRSRYQRAGVISDAVGQKNNTRANAPQQNQQLITTRHRLLSPLSRRSTKPCNHCQCVTIQHLMTVPVNGIIWCAPSNANCVANVMRCPYQHQSKSQPTAAPSKEMKPGIEYRMGRIRGRLGNPIGCTAGVHLLGNHRFNILFKRILSQVW